MVSLSDMTSICLMPAISATGETSYLCPIHECALCFPRNGVDDDFAKVLEVMGVNFLDTNFNIPLHTIGPVLYSKLNYHQISDFPYLCITLQIKMEQSTF